MSRISRLVLCLCLAVTTNLFAEDGPRRGKTSRDAKREEDRQSKSASGIAAQIGDQRQKSRAQTDRKPGTSDRAGKVGRSAKSGNRPGKTGNASSAERRARILERFDENGNGQLDPQERAAAMKALKDRRDGKQKGGDKSGPGRDGDSPKRDKSKRGQSSDRRAQILKQFDKNGDGRLDQAERQAAMKAMRERRGSGSKRPGKGNTAGQKPRSKR